MRLPRIMLAAPASGSGKTMITCGLLQALMLRGQSPASFKCGPDYIDPMFHSRVLGTPSRNLDPFFTDRETTRCLFARSARQAGISVMEGVMGLYDGLGGITPSGSSYELARITETPIVLVVNARGMSLSVVPYLKGFVDYQEQADRMLDEVFTARTEQIEGLETDDRQIYSEGLQKKAGQEECSRAACSPGICGVILNQVTQMTYRLLKPLIEEQTGLQVFGYVPSLASCQIESRHLGLVMPGEIEDLQQRLRTLAGELEKTVDLDGLVALADRAPSYGDEALNLPVSYTAVVQKKNTAYSASAGEAYQTGGSLTARTEPLPGHKCTSDKYSASAARMEPLQNGKVRIAVARDEAFCFYYQDNLELLELLGAELVFFSPVHDSRLPKDCQGILLGGGYPELHAEQLSQNRMMCDDIRAAISDGMPYLAECGGFMYLHRWMQDMEGKEWPMAGVIDGKAYRTGKLGRFGYISLTAQEGQLLPENQTIRGHEFHYFDSTATGSCYHAEKPVTGRSWDCMQGTERSAAGFPHLYYWSNPRFAQRFLEKASSFKLQPQTQKMCQI